MALCRAVVSASRFSRQVAQGRKLHGFAFDIDGVLLRGETPIPGAKEALTLLQKKSVPFALFTNGGGFASMKIAKVNQALGMEVPLRKEQLVVNHSPMRSLVPKYEDKLVLVTGMGDCAGQAREHGFKNVITIDDYAELYPTLWPFCHYVHSLRDSASLAAVEKYRDVPVGAVLVFNEPILWGQDIQIMCDVLASDGKDLATRTDKQTVPLYFSNGDFVWQAQYPTPRFGQGAFITALKSVFEEHTGRALEYTLFGKPQKAAFDFVEKVLLEEAKARRATDLDEIFMIGDNPLSDILGANTAGEHWSSVLVQTGIGTNQQLDAENKLLLPDMEFADVREAVETIQARMERR